MRLKDLVLIALGAFLFVGLVGAACSTDDEGSPQPLPTPTADVPRLTKEEAVGLVASRCELAAGAAISKDAAASYDGDGKWSVQFTLADGSRTDRWTVDETTNTVIPLGVNALDLQYCRSSE